MHQVIFGPIRSFGLLLALSFVVGMWLSVRRGRKRDVPAETVLDVVFPVLVASMVGVRLFYVLTHLDEMDPWYKAFEIWTGGLTLYGGIVGAILAAWWYCRRKGIPFLLMADIMAPQVALGIGLSRLGCFLNGCCYGVPTDGPFGVVFPQSCAAGHAHLGVAIHPTQLYGSLGGFVVWGLLVGLERFWGGRGRTFAMFLMLYAVSRSTVDLFRDFEAGAYAFAGVTVSQAISLGLFIVGAVIFVRGGGRER